LEASLKLSAKPKEANVRNVESSYNGVINVDGKPITSFAFWNYCKLIGIPMSFGNRVPIDLLFTNIERMRNERANDSLVILTDDKGVVTNIVKGPYKEIAYSDVLGSFADKPIRYIDLGEELMTIALTFDELHFDGVGDDDMIYIGTFIYNSILKTVPLHMDSGFYRTSCSNSFIAPYLGRVRATYKLEPQERLLRFADVIRCYDEPIYNRLKTRFSSVFTQRKMFEHEIANLWKKVSSVLDISESDILLKYSEEDRKLLLARTTNWARENKRARLLGESVKEPTQTDAFAYSVLNDITSKARDLHGNEKLELEKIAGKWIEQLILV